LLPITPVTVLLAVLFAVARLWVLVWIVVLILLALLCGPELLVAVFPVYLVGLPLLGEVSLLDAVPDADEALVGGNRDAVDNDRA
jgi:hypothetical protein